MTIPVVFTKIKHKIEANMHLDDRSKKIVLHILMLVFKDIPKEDLIDYSKNMNEYRESPEDTRAFNELFPWLRGDK